MNFERLRWGEWIAAISGLNLLLVTFRAWYKVSGGDGRVTAWDALDNGRYLLIATAIVGVFLLLMQASEDTQRLSFPPGWIAAAVGFACTVYVAYRLATPPSDALDADIGLFLGLASALGVTIGGLLSAREAEPATSHARTASEVAGDTYSGPSGAASEPLGDLVPDSGGTWSPSSGGGSTAGWSPAPAPPAPPATVAGGAAGGLQAGDSVVLTAGGARFPAGTVAQVVDVFTGGALVEVKAPDGMAERFEVPESAYERAPAGGAGTADESWSPAMPAAATDDWGFDEPDAAAEAPAKQPWWKRDIGGGKKKDDDGAALGAAGAVAAGAATIGSETNGTSEEKPGFFKRLFGGGGKDQPETETLESEPTPVSDTAGIGQAAESDTAVHETAAESAVDEAPAAVSEPEPLAAEPEPEVVASEPEPDPGPAVSGAGAAAAGAGAAAAAAAASEPSAPDPEPEVVASEPEPPAPDPEPEVVASEPEPPAPDPEPEVVASEPEPPAPDPEPEPPAPEPEPPAPDPEPEVVASEPEPPAPEPAASAPEPPAPDPEPAASAPDAGPGAAAAGAGAAAAAAASAGDGEEEPKPKPKRKRSSGSRKVPKEAVAAGIDAPPKVGDEVQLKVGGGKYAAGTKGTVVDVFSAGVIVELSDDEGRTERLDLPFEAIGPADA